MRQSKRPVHVPLHQRPLSFFEAFRAARQNLLGIIPDVMTREPIISGITGGKRWHMVAHPEAMRQVMREKADRYPKSLPTKLILRPAIGNSLFIAEGEHWRWQRRAVSPVFAARNIAALTPIMASAAERCAEKIATKEGLDIFEAMTRLTFEVIADVSFRTDAGFDAELVHGAVNRYVDTAGRASLLDLIGAPGWVPRLSRLFGKRHVGRMRKIAESAIAERKKAGPAAIPDLLDHLMLSRDPQTDRDMTVAEIRDNLLTFVVAGHETTALTLSWALYLLAFDPERQEKARAEVMDLTGGAPPTADQVKQLVYVRAVLEEALRLYPPAPFLPREALADDVLMGRKVVKGDTVFLPIYALHRHKALWPEPDYFRPERFLAPVHDRFAYLPFGDGPRVCVGMQFALHEAVVSLATLLGRLRFKMTERTRPKPVAILTLRPEGGVWLDVEVIKPPANRLQSLSEPEERPGQEF